MPQESNVGSVLVIDRDPFARKLIAAALRDAGFRTRAVSRIEALRETIDADVIVCDRWQPLALVAPELLSRTVVATARWEEELPPVHAVLHKPLDPDELVRVVGTCARQAEAVDIRTLQRFVSEVPALRRVLTSQWSSQREVVLRGEMRRTVSRLSAAFREVARQESSRTRAEAFLAASVLAAELAEAPVTLTVARGDH